jgi:hypothetical protein
MRVFLVSSSPLRLSCRTRLLIIGFSVCSGIPVRTSSPTHGGRENAAGQVGELSVVTVLVAVKPIYLLQL